MVGLHGQGDPVHLYLCLCLHQLFLEAYKGQTGLLSSQLCSIYSNGGSRSNTGAEHLSFISTIYPSCYNLRAGSFTLQLLLVNHVHSNKFFCSETVNVYTKFLLLYTKRINKIIVPCFSSVT